MVVVSNTRLQPRPSPLFKFPDVVTVEPNRVSSPGDQVMVIIVRLLRQVLTVVPRVDGGVVDLNRGDLLTKETGASSSLEPMNTSCQIQILRNPISARLIAHSFFRVWLNLGCSTKYFSMNMFPQSRMTRCGEQRSDVAFCRSLPRGEFLCEALHHWSATANEKMPLVMIFDVRWTFDLWWSF